MMRQVLETFVTWSVMAHFAERVLVEVVLKAMAISAGG
jgi:hypothetical protein